MAARRQLRKGNNSGAAERSRGSRATPAYWPRQKRPRSPQSRRIVEQREIS
jgi:hypothetical protein